MKSSENSHFAAGAGRTTSMLLTTGLILSVAFMGLVATKRLMAETKPPANAVSEKEQVKWRDDLSSALADAKKLNKKVLLRFSAEWCPPCRVMDVRVWPDKSVQDVLSEHYIIVKADIDEDASKILATKYRVSGVPTLVLLNPDGTEISRGSFMSSVELVKFLNGANQNT